jgi:hypothetical protein
MTKKIDSVATLANFVVGQNVEGPEIGVQALLTSMFKKLFRLRH